MSAVGDDETFGRASTIIAGSRMAALVERILRLSVAAVRTSRSLATARHCVQAFHAMPADERRWCVVLLLAAALTGHLVMAAMLPMHARPTLTLTALAFLAAGFATGAAARRNR
jgi:hypothetical protein